MSRPPPRPKGSTSRTSRSGKLRANCLRMTRDSMGHVESSIPAKPCSVRLGDRHEPLSTPVVLDRACVSGEAAAWKPPRQRTDRVARAFDLDESGPERGPQFELAKVDTDQRLEVPPHHHVVAKPRVVVAEVGVGPAQNQPVRAAQLPKLKAHDLPPGWKALLCEMREHGPHEDVGVTVLAPQFEPLLPPGSESSDHRSKLRP